MLDGAMLHYGSATELRATLNYDFDQEEKFSYKNLSMDDIIHHLAVFISRPWQIHVFGDRKVLIRSETLHNFLEPRKNAHNDCCYGSADSH